MTKTKSTKRALLMSALALLMCVSMLIGSTFAWFTDSVTSGGNVIKSGTLDVTMEWLDGKVAPADDAAWIDASSGAIFDYDRWEPGYAEVRHIKIENEGTLALKYQLHIVPTGEVSKLADVIDVYYINPAQQITDRTQLTDNNKIGTLAEVLADLNGKATATMGNLEAGAKQTLTLAFKMQETAGNEYQNLTIGSEFSIVLFATQYTSESDSFNNQYDAGAELPVVTSVDSQAELNAAISAGADTVYLAEGTYKLPGTTNNEIALIGNGETVIDLSYATGQSLSGTDITLENLIVTGSNENYTGLQHVGNVVYNNVVFNNSTNLYGESVTFNDCTFNLTSRYIWTYGAGVATFNNCTFYTEGKAILAYKESDPATYTVNINNCTFAASSEGYTSSGDHCAAVEIDSSLVGAYVVNFTGTNTVSKNFSDLYRIKKQNNNNATVNQNGTVVYAETVTAASQADLTAAIASGDAVNVTLAAGTYKLPTTTNKEVTISGTKDTVIDLSNGTGQMQNMSFVFDGVTIKGATQNYKGIIHSKSVAYKNCTLTGLQFLYAETVTFENCDFDSNGQEHSIWTYGSKNVSFVDCDFTYADRAVNVYLDNGTGSVNVSFEGCTFTTSNTASKGAVEINSSAFPLGANVSFVNCTAPAYGTMVGISGWDSANGANAAVTVDGAAFTPAQWAK